MLVYLFGSYKDPRGEYKTQPLEALKITLRLLVAVRVPLFFPHKGSPHQDLNQERLKVPEGPGVLPHNLDEDAPTEGSLVLKAQRQTASGAHASLWEVQVEKDRDPLRQNSRNGTGRSDLIPVPPPSVRGENPRGV